MTGEKERLAILETQLPHIKAELEEMRDDLLELREWKRRCSLAAAGWGGICMAATTIGAWVYSYWENIKHFFSEIK